MELDECDSIPTELANKIFNPFLQEETIGLSLTHDNFEAIRSDCRFYSCPSISKPGKNENNLNILHVNARSILSDIKFDEFQALISTSKSHWHIICVSESWLYDEMIPLRELEGYTGYFKNRNTRTGGGVIIYVSKRHIKCSSELSIDATAFEAVFVLCTISPSISFIIGQLYKPPSLNFTLFMDDLNACLSKLDEINKTTFLCGDFNMDLFALETDNQCQLFFNTISSFGYWPTISKTTRASDEKLSLLDNIFCNNLDFISKSGVIYSDTTDHFPVFVSCAIQPQTRIPELQTIFNKNKVGELSTFLAEHLQHSHVSLILSWLATL